MTNWLASQITSYYVWKLSFCCFPLEYLQWQITIHLNWLMIAQHIYEQLQMDSNGQEWQFLMCTLYGFYCTEREIFNQICGIYWFMKLFVVLILWGFIKTVMSICLYRVTAFLFIKISHFFPMKVIKIKWMRSHKIEQSNFLQSNSFIDLNMPMVKLWMKKRNGLGNGNIVCASFYILLLSFKV